MQGGEQQDAPLEGERGPRSHDPCGVPGILMLQKESSTENVWKSNIKKIHKKKTRVQTSKHKQREIKLKMSTSMKR